MNYKITYSNPRSHYIDLEVRISTKGRKKLQFQLPAWRPGRYELGDFAKNVQKWAAFDGDGNQLDAKKISKDRWEVSCGDSKEVVVRYNYFANELNAGSTYLSDDQLYVNPVNCMIYEVDNMEEDCQLELDIPDAYEVATSLKKIKNKLFTAANFDELADSPFIASATLKHHEFLVDGITFHLWFQGECKPDWEKLVKDFKAYTAEQIALFGDFPVKDYHYLFQIVPHMAYHGVEHSASTVIALGPSYDIMNEKGKYNDLLGVSSHELFHTWNVKRIRPIEMWPYDFSQENYSRLGYLAEGVTTWYGDAMLYRSGVFDDAAYFKTFNQLLDRHFNNPGALNLSVADSSFDTWLDGYTLGVPNRKSSIYVEGALVTFLLDYIIRKNSQNQQSFDDVLRVFYRDFYQQGKGISEADYKATVEKQAGESLDEFFRDYVNGTKDMTKALEEAFAYYGIQWIREGAEQFQEASLGVRMLKEEVYSVYPGSPADRAGISVKDKIISINGIQIQDNLSEWLRYFKKDQIVLELTDDHQLRRNVELKLNEKYYYSNNQLSWKKEMNIKQKANAKAWSRR